MRVKDIIILSAKLLDRQDIVKYLNDGVTDNYDYVNADIQNLVNAYNVCQDEIAREYFDLIRIDNFTPTNGKVKYADFTYKPIAVYSVTNTNGEKCDAIINPTYIETDVEITCKYAYIPDDKTLNDELETEFEQIGKRVFSYGLITEYCLVKGMYEDGVSWQKKYQDSLYGVLRDKKGKTIKSRKWF